MKYFHNIIISVFSKPEDDYFADEEALLSIFPFKLSDEKLRVEKEEASGFNERKIHIRTVKLEKDKHIKQFIEQLSDKLGNKQREELLKQENRLDDQLNFYLRLDKARLMKGRYKLTESGDCIHIKCRVAAFPKKREVARELLKEIFK